jgi:hypothetical protein
VRPGVPPDGNQARRLRSDPPIFLHRSRILDGREADSGLDSPKRKLRNPAPGLTHPEFLQSDHGLNVSCLVGHERCGKDPPRGIWDIALRRCHEPCQGQITWLPIPGQLTERPTLPEAPRRLGGLTCFIPRPSVRAPKMRPVRLHRGDRSSENAVRAWRQESNETIVGQIVPGRGPKRRLARGWYGFHIVSHISTTVTKGFAGRPSSRVCLQEYGRTPP